MAHPDSDRPTSDPLSINRRTLLAGLGVGAAGLLSAGSTTGDFFSSNPHAVSEGRPGLTTRGGPAFEHVVVLMLENRSYDHLLGWLYRDDQLRPGQHFAGLYQHPSSNRAPDGTVVHAYQYAGSRNSMLVRPETNTGEDLGHVDRQLFGTARPIGRPSMTGFVADYVDNYRAIRGAEPSLAEYRQVMGGFAPSALPVLSTLARSFGVCDHWFAAVPSDTFCNRSFFHAATSHGFTTNAGQGGYSKWLNAPAVPTVFNRLQDAGVPWRVYYDETQAVSLTGILAAPSIEDYWLSNFRSMEQFRQDARSGILPAYSFIEPRMIFDRNSMHPPTIASRTIADGPTPYNKGVADMLAGEALVAEVYEAIRLSASAGGSNAENTTLIITFDESGGLFDHVPPPTAVPPGDGVTAGEGGFTFDRLGCRVPSIVISAWTDSGTVINDRLDHTSVIATLTAQHGLAPLTDRDVASGSLFAAVNRNSPRSAASWPAIPVPSVPRPPTPLSIAKSHPQTATGLGILGVVLARFEPDAVLPASISSAFDSLTDHGAGLFGTRDPLRRAL